MGSKVHKQKYGETVLTPQRHWSKTQYDTPPTAPQSYATS